MFLYRLELQGFKSFVDKTTVEFGGGITGVVGPNGCGKTNVSEAIRWVMGEQSARQLRGDSMEDVIFNGCPTRKPIGMAEVHLTFKNDRGILPTDFSEVMVSRKVFRSGMSEYFLNGAPCRLKDIRDLFFDTGMGSHAYSVIERQMVDHVLSDNSGHRRFLFEEASGITKYKSRKKEALNKLEATETDLTRLNDIVYEIERELRSLARQVGKARRYQRLRDAIRDLDLKLTAGRIRELGRKEAEAKERWQEEAVNREGVTAALDQLEARLNDQKLSLLELERELATGQSGLRDREEARNQAEHQVVLLEERAAGLMRRGEEASHEAARMRERLAEVADSEKQAEDRRGELRLQRENIQLEAEQREGDLVAVEAELRQRRSAEVERKQLSLDLFSAEAEKRGACERLRERQSSIDERIAAARGRLEEMDLRLAALARTSAAHGERRSGLELELAEARTMLAQVERRIAELDSGLQQADTALARLLQDSAAAESRLETLLELKRNFEGVSEGVRALLAGGEPPAGVLGVVADVLEVPARYVDALEASLGEAAAFVLVEDRASLEGALERLRGVGSGRATLVDLAALGSSAPPAIPDESSVIGRASDLVRCEDRFRPLIERLLGTVVMVEDRAAAARLAQKAEGGLRFVSLDGEVWERGRVRAGSSLSLGGLLHRETEIRELTGRLAELSLAVEGQSRERESIETRRARTLEERGVAGIEVDARRAALEALSRELEAAEHERHWADGEAAERRREILAYEAETEALARARVRADEELDRFQRELEAARAQIKDLDDAVRALEQRRDETLTRAQTTRDQLLRISREEGEWETRWARAEQTRRELESGLEARGEEERHSRARLSEIEAEVQGLKTGLSGLLESETVQRQRVTELSARYHTLKSEVQTAEEEARRRRFEQTELAELLHQIELERIQIRAEHDRTFERLQAEYQMDPTTWSPEPDPEDFDRPAAERDLEASRERFRTLGVVNLLALEEYTKKKERFTFLVQQRGDLTNARGQLLEAIDKINVTARELFLETFAKVQIHFREVFKTLFEGGDAELRALGDDPLECEIEIVAKPRGKHLQSISLMSGGERALTAIALLFAIYLVKPSPFCLLDEVDAPLDDANVDRFLNMLRRFSEKTQFVVITHNKKTMEAAGCLYGVTMQELGVSKLVSVRFDRSGGESSDSIPATAEMAGASAG
jgi:chromosome segregation protein